MPLQTAFLKKILQNPCIPSNFAIFNTTYPHIFESYSGRDASNLKSSHKVEISSFNLKKETLFYDNFAQNYH